MEDMDRELTDPTLELLEEFTAAWLRGEAPDPRAALEQARDEEREQLSALIERFLLRQPSREPTAESLAHVREVAALADALAPITDAPLVEARNRVGMKREQVIAELRRALGLSSRDDAKLRRHYHRLESGLLDTRRVSIRVWTALESILDWRGDPTHRQPLAVTAGAFARSADSSTPASDVAASLGFDDVDQPVVWETVDELFLGPMPS
jgi:hypothetical protein